MCPKNWIRLGKVVLLLIMLATRFLMFSRRKMSFYQKAFWDEFSRIPSVKQLFLLKISTLWGWWLWGWEEKITVGPDEKVTHLHKNSWNKLQSWSRYIRKKNEVYFSGKRITDYWFKIWLQTFSRKKKNKKLIFHSVFGWS